MYYTNWHITGVWQTIEQTLPLLDNHLVIATKFINACPNVVFTLPLASIHGVGHLPWWQQSVVWVPVLDWT